MGEQHDSIETTSYKDVPVSLSYICKYTRQQVYMYCEQKKVFCYICGHYYCENIYTANCQLSIYILWFFHNFMKDNIWVYSI